MKVKHGLFCILGTVVMALFYELAYAVAYFLKYPAQGMKIVYLVILSPVVSIPLGFFVFLLGWSFSFLLKLHLGIQHWFLLGAVSALIFPLLDIIHLIGK